MSGLYSPTQEMVLLSHRVVELEGFSAYHGSRAVGQVLEMDSLFPKGKRGRMGRWEGREADLVIVFRRR